MIEVKNLAKNYLKTPALSGLSFRIDKGQIAGLIGGKGSGKTTAMDMISGSMDVPEGAVFICGKDMYLGEGEAKSHLGYMPERPPLYREMTPRSYLRFVCDAKLMPHKMASDEISRVLGLTGLKEVADKPLRHLSEGIRRRASLAQALIGDPDVLLLDEPTKGLDPKEIIALRALVRELGKERAVLIATGNISEAANMCHVVMVLKEGAIVSRGTPNELSRMQMDSGSISLKIKGGEAAIRSALSGMTIQSCVPSEGDTQHVVLANRPDVREQAFYALCRANLPILYMAPVTVSLDDVLVQLESEDFGAQDFKEGESAHESGL